MTDSSITFLFTLAVLLVVVIVVTAMVRSRAASGIVVAVFRRPCGFDAERLEVVVDVLAARIGHEWVTRHGESVLVQVDMTLPDDHSRWKLRSVEVALEPSSVVVRGQARRVVPKGPRLSVHELRQLVFCAIRGWPPPSGGGT